jgi:TRAP-type mannitol/chloroaromatic compound transport system substrate-binding protein
MKRREFLTQAGLGSAASLALVSQAIAQQAGELPTVQWRMQSSNPKSLDILYGAAESVGAKVSAITGGKFTIRVFPSGGIVPGLQFLDAVQAGTVECGHGPLYFFYGKDPTFAFSCAMPFGMNMRQQSAWMYHGGGLELTREFLKDYGVMNFPAGNSGGQMGGFFRKEIKTVDDLKGLKFRVGGFAGAVFQKLGVVPQQLNAGDIYPALEKGTLDAAEFSGPYDDEKQGFHQVAKNYYFPGWWEGTAELDLVVNIKAWEALPAVYQSVLDIACYATNLETVSKFDTFNPPALKRLLAAGVQLRPFPNEVMTACYKAAHDLYDETAAKNAKFKKVYEPWKRFRDEQVQWFSIVENRFDNFMIAQQRIAQAGQKK